MAEVLYATSHIAGSYVNPGNAVGNTPGTWAGELNTNTSVSSRWALDDPVDPLTASVNQTVEVVARKGSNSGVPTITLNLYENGSLVRELVAATNVTSEVGQVISGAFTEDEISNPANIEIEVVMSAATGSGTVRNSAQVSHFTFTADTTPLVEDHSGGSTATVAVAPTGGGTSARSDGSGADVTVAPAAGGTKQVSGGSGTTVEVTPTGAGEPGLSPYEALTVAHGVHHYWRGDDSGSPITAQVGGQNLPLTTGAQAAAYQTEVVPGLVGVARTPDAGTSTQWNGNGSPTPLGPEADEITVAFWYRLGNVETATNRPKIDCRFITNSASFFTGVEVALGAGVDDDLRITAQMFEGFFSSAWQAVVPWTETGLVVVAFDRDTGTPVGMWHNGQPVSFNLISGTATRHPTWGTNQWAGFHLDAKAEQTVPSTFGGWGVYLGTVLTDEQVLEQWESLTDAGQALSGGSTATVTVAPTGAGTKHASAGSSPGAVSVAALGAGTKAATSGSTATIIVTPLGAGSTARSGGATSTVLVSVTGGGDSDQPDPPTLFAVIRHASEVLAVLREPALTFTAVGRHPSP